MAKCADCGTIHGTKMYRRDGEKVTYCVHCAPLDVVEVVDHGPRVCEYPDRR